MLDLLAFDYGASSGRAMLGKFDGNRLSLSEMQGLQMSRLWFPAVCIGIYSDCSMK